MRTLADLIGYALEGAPHDTNKAEDLLQFFCDAVEANKVPDEAILKYLAGCFRLVLDGKPPADALSLSGSKGKRRRRTLERKDQRNFDIARAVVGHMAAGMKRNDAIEHVTAAHNVSTAVAKRAYETYRATIHAQRDFDLAHDVEEHMKRGKTREDAIKSVAAEQNVSVSVVKGAYEKQARAQETYRVDNEA
jgi:hypothetical protein